MRKVQVEDVCGDVENIFNEPITLAEVVTEQENGTWTFYKLSTMHSSLTIRWLGVSNGYYSENVSCDRKNYSIDNT